MENLASLRPAEAARKAPPDRGSTDLIPRIESRLFDTQETAHLAVGIVARGEQISKDLDCEYQGYLVLRGNVYAKEKLWMPVAELNADGTETDADDQRSVHFVVVENDEDGHRVVATMRLITKSLLSDQALPIEDLYPEAFACGPAPPLSVEVSRLICRHENPKIQRRLKWSLFASGVSYTIGHGLGPVFGAVEEDLHNRLETDGVPCLALGEPKFVPEMNATKLPVRVDVATLAQKIIGDQPDARKLIQAGGNSFVYFGTARRRQVAGVTDVF